MTLFHPEVTAVGPEGWPETAEAASPEEVRRQFETLIDPWEESRVELLERTMAGDAVLVHAVWHTRGRTSELEGRFDLWHLLRIRDGQIIRQEFHWTHEAALRAAGEVG